MPNYTFFTECYSFVAPTIFYSNVHSKTTEFKNENTFLKELKNWLFKIKEMDTLLIYYFNTT